MVDLKESRSIAFHHHKWHPNDTFNSDHLAHSSLRQLLHATNLRSLVLGQISERATNLKGFSASVQVIHPTLTTGMLAMLYF